MELNFNIKTTVFFGKDIVIENENIFESLGKRAYIVTGKTSAIMSEYLNYAYLGSAKKVQKILDYLKIKSLTDFNDIIKSVFYNISTISNDEIVKFAKSVVLQKNVLNTNFKVTEDIVMSMFKNAFERKTNV